MNWYCLHTKPAKERAVESYLRDRLSIETFLPQAHFYRTIRRKRRRLLCAVFPRYLFVRIDESTSFRAARFAPDVVDIVSKGTTPTKVSDSLIDEIKQWSGNVDFAPVAPEFSPGDRVRIADGPLLGMSATVLRASDEKERVTLLLSILECGAQATVNRSLLVPLREAS